VPCVRETSRARERSAREGWCIAPRARYRLRESRALCRSGGEAWRIERRARFAKRRNRRFAGVACPASRAIRAGMTQASHANRQSGLSADFGAVAKRLPSMATALGR
jgi:hypothetical protein